MHEACRVIFTTATQPETLKFEVNLEKDKKCKKKKKKKRSDRTGIKDIRERRNWVRFLKAAAASRGAVYFRGVLGRAKRGCAGESLSSADKLKDGNSVSRVLTPRSLL